MRLLGPDAEQLVTFKAIRSNPRVSEISEN